MQSDQSAVVGSASPLVFVSCYDTFGNLAHTPHGTEAKHSMYTYRLNLERGDLTLMSVSTEPCTNPAFLRYHPTQNILYACTESIHEEGLVVAYSVSPTTGQLSKLGAQSALGTSTCYLTVDNDAKHLLFVNYWDSTLGALPLTPTGLLAGPVCELLQPPNPIRKTKREDHLSSRQSEDHAHAIVLDPVHGRIAYVPDLGKECVKVRSHIMEICALAHSLACLLYRVLALLLLSSSSLFKLRSSCLGIGRVIYTSYLDICLSVSLAILARLASAQEHINCAPELC